MYMRKYEGAAGIFSKMPEHHLAHFGKIPTKLQKLCTKAEVLMNAERMLAERLKNANFNFIYM
jgi:hypothetical protein